MLLAGTILLLTSCGSGPVPVQSPQPKGAAAHSCTQLHAALPDTLGEQPRRKIEPQSSFAAAWGKEGAPPIVVRCGVARPARLQPTSRLTVVNGVEWFPEPDRSPVRFTTTGRVARVELAWPEQYGVPAETLVELAKPIKQAVPENS